MNDATKAPERIWVNYKEANRLYVAYDMPPRDEFDDCRDPYILATPAALTASPEVAALIREAEARGRAEGMLAAIEVVAEERNKQDSGPLFEVLNKALGKVDNARFAAIRAEAAALRGEKETK